MVRLETNLYVWDDYDFEEFTFQYGQIRNIYEDDTTGVIVNIYIPVWLDQKHCL